MALGGLLVFLGKDFIELVGPLVIFPPLADSSLSFQRISAEHQRGIEDWPIARAATELAVIEAFEILFGMLLIRVQPGFEGHDEARGAAAALGAPS